MKNKYPAVPTYSLVLFLFFSNSYALTNFSGSVKSRFERGEEVNPYLFADYPNNLSERNFFELYISSELNTTDIPFGGRLRLGLRLFEFQPSSVERRMQGLEYQRRLDKIYSQLNIGKWEIWLGDVYETYGRGLALNLMENQDLYFDSGVRGGKINYNGGGWRVKTIAGESREGYLVNREQLAAVNLENRSVKGMKLGLSNVYQRGVSLEERFTPGAYFQIQRWGFTLFGEYAQTRDNKFDELLGDGTYLNLNWGLMGAAVNLEYKYYKFGFDAFNGDSLVENPFRTPPVVQREITTHLMSEHPHLPLTTDQVGFNAEISYSPWYWLFLTSSYSRASSHEGGNLFPSLKEEYKPFWEWFTEGELYPSDKTIVKFAFGMNEEARPFYWRKKTGTLADITYYLSPFHSLTIGGENMLVKDEIYDAEFQEWKISMTLAKASVVSVNFLYQWTTEDLTDEDEFWPGGEIAFTLNSSNRLTMFFGRERGGLKCTSGVCRPVQPFEGLRITLQSAF